MGTIINRTMFVSLFHDDHADMFEAYLRESDVPYYRHLTEINACHEFWLPTSGSKLGWETDDNHRARLDEACKWLDHGNATDAAYSAYVMVDFDECTPRVVRSEWPIDGDE